MKFWIVAIIIFNFSSCLSEKDSGGGGTSGGGPGDSTQESPLKLALSFERQPQSGLDPVQIDLTITRDNDGVADLTPRIESTLGSIGEVQDLGAGKYRAILTPTQTGEHKVTASYDGVSISRTPLVMYDVHPDWGQPMAVEGYVNTAGYEDGITVTPDGEYLFAQTSPQYFSAIFLFSAARPDGCGGDRLSPSRCEHPWINNLVGPYTAPERPGFFDGRYSGNTILHNANSWGVGNDQAPNYAFSSMFYGFKKQADGSFKEPFYVAISDVNDGILGPFGLSFVMNGDGTATTLFSFDDPTDPDMVDWDNDGPDADDVQSYIDVWKTTITLGQNNTLGEFVYSGTPGTPPIRGSYFNPTVVDFGKTGFDGIIGTQGNPHLHAVNGVTKSIWTDDEYDSGGDHGEISVFILDSGDLDSGTWTKVVLPNKINIADPSNEIQPFFTGDKLFFTRSDSSNNPEVWVADYTGPHSQAGFSDNANWGTPERVMTFDPDVTGINKIPTIGEPTIATVNGETYLYFVYGYVRSIDSGTGIADYDLQAGYIKLNSN